MGKRRMARGHALKVMLVASSGGHLAQLVRLEPWYRHHEVRWVTFPLPDAVSLLSGADVVWAHHPTTRSIKNLIRNAVLAARELRRSRPDLIVSCGAGVAVPFFWIGKLLGTRTVFVETFDRLDDRSMTALLVSPVTDLFLVQSPRQMALYPGSHLIGALL